MAYGLLLADRQWGSAGTYDYKSLAVRHINAIKADEVNPSTHLTKLGDWSSSGDQYYYVSRSSDWMIDHFRAFKRATGDAAWDTFRAAHQNLITTQQATYASGLLADFVVDTNGTPKPAGGQVLEGPNDGDYSWNACSQAWLDALWSKLAGTAIDPALYYGGSVQLQSMIVASGNYWVP